MDEVTFFNQLTLECDGIIIDVQTEIEYQQAHLQSALFSPNKKSLNSFCDTLKRETILFVYCKYGDRSKTACSLLQKKGFHTIYQLENGIESVIQNKSFASFFEQIIAQ
ncbi:MAG: rhodanese-like domain-containing protein [Salinivirgaceae bacterium]|nr:rhodanese-like domain-containing protein [Salinivirgaceae bacterium]